VRKKPLKLQKLDLKWLHDTLEANEQSPASRAFTLIYYLVLAMGLGGAVLSTSHDLDVKWGNAFSDAIFITAFFFFSTYVLRLISASQFISHAGTPRWRLRLTWATSPQGLIDAAGALPLFVILLYGGINRTVDIVSIVWVFKFFRYAPGTHILGRVFHSAWESLFSVFVAFLVILLTAATLIFVIEGDAQPATYGSIPLSLWWTIVTLTTTGYGDVTPITPLGRMLAGTVMICGIAVFALWAGILANAFASEVKRHEFLRTWDMISQVPMFTGIGTETIADIARVLKTVDYKKGATIFRRNAPGDCMYFIASGAVKVKTYPDPVLLGPGDFFGEISLITGELRSAKTVAARASQLLVLDIADFRVVASRHPELAKAVNDQAKLRMASARA
jgi:voltage-gated potassium channel